ncbi:MAG TPA: hypothetical protein PLQ41_04425 [bacterium]|nr:hypothetical protein [bacterium]
MEMKKDWFWGNKRGVRFEKSTIKLTNDGVYLSDLYLTAMLLCCVDGTLCEKAVKIPESPNKLHFFVRGNPNDIREFLNYFFNGQKAQNILVPKVDELRAFTNKVSYLKAVLDRSKVNIKNG